MKNIPNARVEVSFKSVEPNYGLPIFSRSYPFSGKFSEMPEDLLSLLLDGPIAVFDRLVFHVDVPVEKMGHVFGHDARSCERGTLEFSFCGDNRLKEEMVIRFLADVPRSESKFQSWVAEVENESKRLAREPAFKVIEVVKQTLGAEGCFEDLDEAEMQKLVEDVHKAMHSSPTAVIG